MSKLKTQNSKLKTAIQKLKFCVLSCSFAFFIFNFAFICFAQEPGEQTPDSREEESLFVAKKAFDDGFYDVSLGLLERFQKNYPASSKSPEVNLLIGRCYFHQNRFLDALGKFEELMSQPKTANIRDAVLYWTAEVHFRGNVFDKAAGYYRRIIKEFPDSTYVPAAYYSLGWCLFQEQKYGEAKDIFKVVEERFPKEPQAKDAGFKIVECLYNLKDYTGLKARLKEYFKIYSKDTTRLSYLHFYMAEAEYYLDDLNAALQEYALVIKNNRDEKMQALSKLGMGWSYLKLKRYTEAETLFLEIKPQDLEKRSLDVLLLGKAILMVETNRVNEAKATYEELLKNTSDPVVLIQAYLGKADSLYNLSDYQQAIDAYRQGLEKAAIETVPRELVDKLYYGLSWSYLKQGEFKEAIKEFQKIVKGSDDNIVKVSALCQIGDAYQDSGDYAKAQETYDTILRDYPDSFYNDYVQYQLGLTMLKASNYDAAIMSLLSLKSNFPTSKLLDDATYALGLAYFQRQDYNASRETFEKFQEEFKESNLRPESLYLLGTSLYNLGKFNEAIEAFKNIIRVFSQDTELVQKAEYEIADCFYQMGNEKEAMNRFNALRAKYPDSNLTAEIMWWLGGYYYRQNQPELARRYFSSLIADFPRSNLVADAYYAIGSSFEEESRFDEAIENFQKVVKSGSSDLSAQASLAIADIHVSQEKFEAALKEYEDIKERYPNLANLVYPKMADLFLKMNNLSGSLDFYRKCLDVVPVKEMAGIQFKIAEVLQAKGDLSSAIEEYLKVTYLYSENNALAIKALLRTAAIYEGRENFKEAMNIYKRVVSLDVQEAKYAQERIDWIKAHVK